MLCLTYGNMFLCRVVRPTRNVVLCILQVCISFIPGKVYMCTMYTLCRKISRRETSSVKFPGNVCKLPLEKFPPENFGKSGKLPVGKISPGEFREIRETSRRENLI